MIIYYKFIFFILSIEYVTSKTDLKNIKWKCANENCSKIISEGVANRDYKVRLDEDKLLFINGEKFQSYKKSEGYFYVKDSKGVEGIVEKSYFRETKSYVKDNELVDEVKVENLNSPNKTSESSESSWSTQTSLSGQTTKYEGFGAPNSTSDQTGHKESKSVAKTPAAYDPYKYLEKTDVNNTNSTDQPQKTEVLKISVQSSTSVVNGPKVENLTLLPDTNSNITGVNSDNNKNTTLNSTVSNASQELANQTEKQKSNDEGPRDAQEGNGNQKKKPNSNEAPSDAQGDNGNQNKKPNSNDIQPNDAQGGNGNQNKKPNSNDKQPNDAQGGNGNQYKKQNSTDEPPNDAQGGNGNQDEKQNSTDKPPNDAQGGNGNQDEKQNSTDEPPTYAQGGNGNQDEKQNSTDKPPNDAQGGNGNQDEKQNSTDEPPNDAQGGNGNQNEKENLIDVVNTSTSTQANIKKSNSEKSEYEPVKDNVNASTKKLEEPGAISTESKYPQNDNSHGKERFNEQNPSKFNAKNFYFGSHVHPPEYAPNPNPDLPLKTSQTESSAHKKVNSSQYSDEQYINDKTNKSEEKIHVQTPEIVPKPNSNPLLKTSQTETPAHKQVNSSQYPDKQDIYDKNNKSEEKIHVQTPEIVPKPNSNLLLNTSQTETPVHKQVDSSQYSDEQDINGKTNKSEEKNPVQTPENVPKPILTETSQTVNDEKSEDFSQLKDNDSKNKITTSDVNSEIANESVTNDEKIENDSTMFSGVYSIMQSLQDMLSKSPLPKQETPEPIIENIEEEIAVYTEYHSEETCTVDSSWMSLKTICLLGFTSIVILIFSLGYYYMDNSKRDFELVTKNNELASELFILQKERTVLEERLQTAEENASQNSGEASKYTYEVESLRTELNVLKNEKTQMEEKEQVLIKKCSMLETNYVKLRQMVSESKQKGERSILIADIKKLKESSTTEILSLKEQLDIKNEETKTLMVKLAKANELKDRLEEKLNTMMSEEQIAVKHYQDSVSKLEQMIEESKATVIKLEDEVGKLKKDNESLIIEKELAETSLQKAHGLKSSESLSAWLQSKEIQIALVKTQKNLEDLQLKYNELLNEKSSLSDKEKSLQTEFEELNEKYEQAEKAKIEALTKLQVLSDYFNEKETQLQEELGTKEALWLQKQSDDHTIYEQMRTLREENQTFKNQNETLKKEIIDQETSYKKLIASAEEKADGYWVSLRQAERRLKETQIEAAQLRNRLTAIETSEISDDKKVEVNGDMPYGPPTSPPFMLYPSEFIPPPPLIPTTPSRPPPLGRISSPTLGDFTPPLPLPPFDLFPPSPPPPPPSHYVHKPQPRETRKQKDSQSSNHSSESTDKMHRRTKR